MTNQAPRMNIVFDPSTGKILGASMLFDVAKGGYREQSREEVLALFAEDSAAQKINVLDVDLPLESLQRDCRVDVERRQLVPKLQLRMKADRTEMRGDGKDSIEIEIQVVDEHGELVTSFDSELRVTTTRGRLSELGGRIKAENGTSRIMLTSVPETIARVTVEAHDPSERCTRGAINFEFL